MTDHANRDEFLLDLPEAKPAGITGRMAMKMVDKGVNIPGPVVANFVNKLRTKHPDDTPGQIIGRIDRYYLNTVTSTGAAVGATAAVPGVGTVAALAAAGGETAVFFATSAFYTLALAEVYNLPIEDVERRRALVMSIAMGNTTSVLAEKAALRKGRSWADTVANVIPSPSIGKLNAALARRMLLRLAQTRGFMTIGRIVPFGVGAAIGAATNRTLGRALVVHAHKAFGPPPRRWLSPPAAEIIDHEADANVPILLPGE
ncbi:hypothetical protein IEU95_13570 [Hoyosella rhizosphaerae]|uniref:EcsC family protein n=1 Tax=Hoyosella rhizosphaerae TaxID=1755582 RepID=A0A916UFA1_9ACTN|nr:hypothetical protein [Hoyosella rhizosphaerae]MBN4927868.1 hypothetical protein [Hoyosella rhizosphaerae]GGC70587.1 hypothetical protein GCM10011410_24310 [Hoyosella rhizosphaerae]